MNTAANTEASGSYIGSADFLQVLKDQGHFPKPVLSEGASKLEGTEGTTILAVRYKDGVMVAGDRRATMGNTVVYDRADKVLTIDDCAVMALSGSPGMAYEIARVLEMSLQHHRRSQLQELSLDGKLRLLSRLLRDNLQMAMQGVGAVIPIFAAYDEASASSKIFFCDILGAQFESVDFYTTGSGSPIIRGALYYLNRWGAQPFAEMAADKVLELVVKMLETAAEYDTATGGFRRQAQIFPQVIRVTAAGLETVAEEELAALYAAGVQEES
jgi:proteasome beta subunit